MSPRPFAPAILFAAVAIGLSTPAAHSVIHANGNGTANTTAPVDDFHFANVGLVFNTLAGAFGSGVYLGDGWVLGAYHNVSDVPKTGFLFGDIYFNGSLYTADAASAVRLTTPGQGPSDLALFRLASLPGDYPVLPSLSLSLITPITNSQLALAGDGRNRQTTPTQWNVAVNPGPDDDVWTETPGPGTRQGFEYAAGTGLRWGKNLRNAVPVQNVDDGFGITRMFQTTFSNDLTALADEAQASPGDSGGGVFYKNGLNWELAGIMLAIDRYDGQPSESAVYGTDTYIADLAAYRTQIAGIVPEPGTAALGVFGALLLGARRRR